MILIKRLPVIVMLTLTVYLLAMASVDSYDLAFSDQVDLLYGYLEQRDLLTLFMQQHGPHRQGLGVLVMLPALQLFGWNVEALAYITVAIMFVSAVFIILALSAAGVGLFSTVAAVFVVLSFGSSELITITPNVSHSALPMLFASFVFWHLLRGGTKTVLGELVILTVAIAGLFTGFGIFLFLSYLLILILRLIKDLVDGNMGRCNPVLARYAGCLSLSGLSVYLFLQGYSISLGEGCSSTALANVPNVLIYSFAVAGMPLGGGEPGFAIPIGFIVVFLYAVVSLRAFYLFFRSGDKVSLAVLLLLGISSTFLINAAIGRHCLGIDSAFASRYYILASTGYIAVLVALDRWLSGSRLTVVTPLLSVFIVIANLIIVFPWGKATSAAFHDHKQNFAICQNKGESVRQCNDKFSIYPNALRLERFLMLIDQARQ